MRAEVQIYYNNKIYSCHHLIDIVHHTEYYAIPRGKDKCEHTLELADRMQHSLLEELFTNKKAFGVYVIYESSKGTRSVLYYDGCRIETRETELPLGPYSYMMKYNFVVDQTRVCQQLAGF